MTDQFVNWFRSSSPYIHNHRGHTFVIYIGGETVEHAGFNNIIQDIALLNSLGVRMVLVHGARPQIERQLKTLGLESRCEQGWRITGSEQLPAVEQAVGQTRIHIESLLSRGLINTPMAGAALRVVSGNFVVAKPYGIHNGIDYGHTGEVRRVEAEAISAQLQAGNVVVLSPMGYSPTGEAFNCRAEDVATAAAIALRADKIIFLMDAPGVRDAKGELLAQLSLTQAETVLQHNGNDDITRLHVQSALHACKRGVRRAHLISHNMDGALLLELYTRDGRGTLVTSETYEGLREASINDVGGVLELIAPLEADGTLVRRSREQLELEITRFSVIERDGMIIACAALYPYEGNVAELACLAVHENYRTQGRGEDLLNHMEKQSRARGIEKLFILTTRAAHWFMERGFVEVNLDALPVERRKLYNMQRNSKVFCKTL
jgi:amino-acid N-acetyltransferase